MRALIVGAGYLACSVADNLRRHGWTVDLLSRRGVAAVGGAVTGDVRASDLGLGEGLATELRASVTHLVSCFGSVSWSAGPTTAVSVHGQGTANVMRFAATCERLARIVHASSVLVLGRAKGPVGNGQLDIGQGFRNWYELGKFLAERAVHDSVGVPWRIVRFGPLLGPAHAELLDPRVGVLAGLPVLLQGLPVQLEHGGRFPCYVEDVTVAAEVVRRALVQPGVSETWTWYDDRFPTLADVYTDLCDAWSVVPRIVRPRVAGLLQAAIGPAFGLRRETLAYARPWLTVDTSARPALTPAVSAAPESYLRETGRALRASGRRMIASGPD